MRRTALLFARIAAVALALPLAACADNETAAPDASGQLFARGLDEITDLYIEPVTNRKLSLAGAARLSRLDDKLAVTQRDAGGRWAAPVPTPCRRPGCAGAGAAPART